MPLSDLEQQIHDAFLDAPFPADGYDIYAAQTDDDYGNPTFSTAQLSGRKWYELTPEQLLDCSAAFSYLRPEGWRHYLPALLLLEVRQPGTNLDAIWVLRREESAGRERQEGCHATLDRQQTSAVITFLEYYIERARNIHATHAHRRYAEGGIEWTAAIEPADLEYELEVLAYWQERLTRFDAAA